MSLWAVPAALTYVASYPFLRNAARGPPPVLSTALEDALACPHLQSVLVAAQRAVANPDLDAQESYGDWCRDVERCGVLDSLRGIRGRKKAWWLDSPRPLRVVVARGAKHEVSIVALPGSQELPPAAFPRGSIIACQPLLGQFDVRRVRFDITGKGDAIELMRRTLKQGDAPLVLSGGSCHEYRCAPGVAAAFLQVALLPPTSTLPDVDNSGDGRIGWRRPPGESCEENTDVVSGVTIGVQTAEELLVIDRPSEASLQRDAQMDAGSMPADAPALLRQLGERVGGLDTTLAVIVRRALACRLYPPALTRGLGIAPVRGMLLYGPPGCGKTLLAREISRVMGAREPKIVNGPEMMSKYVGESEGFIRGAWGRRARPPLV